MKIIRLLGRIVVPASLVLLAACQTMPGKKNTVATETQAPAATQPSTTTSPEAAPQSANQEAAVAVFLADTTIQPGWTAVKISAGTLYVNPQPVLTRVDLTGVRAGTNKEGVGLLALDLNSGGQQKVTDVTTKNPRRRLGVVVGHTMMAAPGYSMPVTASQLVFAVGTEQNATAAAQAIAGPDAKSHVAPEPVPAAPASSK